MARIGQIRCQIASRDEAVSSRHWQREHNDANGL